MRKAKIPMNEVIARVMASLKSRMDPETHLVIPSFLTMMRETGVCRQRIAEAAKFLQNVKRVEKVLIKGRDYYRILDV